MSTDKLKYEVDKCLPIDASMKEVNDYQSTQM